MCSNEGERIHIASIPRDIPWEKIWTGWHILPRSYVSSLEIMKAHAEKKSAEIL